MDADEEYQNSQEFQDRRTAIFIDFFGFIPVPNSVIPNDESGAVVLAHLRAEFRNAPPHTIMPKERLVCVDLDIEYVSSVKFGTNMKVKRPYAKNSLLFPAAGVLEITSEDGRGHRRFVTPYGVTINASEYGNYVRFVKVSCQANCTFFYCFVEGTGKLAGFIMAKRPLEAGEIITINSNDRENEPNLNYSCICGEPGCVHDPDRDNPLACHVDDCPKRNIPYKTSKGLKLHNLTKHSNVVKPRVNCRHDCGRDFVDNRAERRHHQHQHLTGEERLRHMFKCMGCNLPFANRTDLGNHQTGPRGCKGMLNLIENTRMQRPETFRTSGILTTSSSESESIEVPVPQPTRQTRAKTRSKVQTATVPEQPRFVSIPAKDKSRGNEGTSSRLVEDGEIAGSSRQRQLRSTASTVGHEKLKEGTATTKSKVVSTRSVRTRAAGRNEDSTQTTSSQDSFEKVEKSDNKKKPNKKNVKPDDKKKNNGGDKKDGDGAEGDSEGTGRYNMRSRK